MNIIYMRKNDIEILCLHFYIKEVSWQALWVMSSKSVQVSVPT